jgi:ribosomal protein S12 methylthiotransferase
MIAALEHAGWHLAAAPELADVLIVNTCGFISSAKKESIETTLELKQRHPGKKVIMVGCLTERYGTELADQLPEIDGFLGNRDPSRILEIVDTGPKAKAKAKGKAKGSPPSPRRRPAATGYDRTQLLSYPGSAYLKIAEGCGNRCTYCAIPLIRGGLASRPPAEIVDEARQLLDRGIRELVLIAQDLGSYGRDLDGASRQGLPALLEKLAGLSGDFWVRLLYIHPDHFPAGILELMAHDPRFLPYFDVPFQHASPRILRAMGRVGDRGANRALVQRIRDTLPGAVVRSTFLLGFPGETDEDFRELLEFQEEVRPDWMGCFTWSREEDTPAYSMPGRVNAATARARKADIEDRQEPITTAALDARVGEVLDVLVEERVQGEALSLGRAYLHAPEVDGLVVVHGSLVPGSRLPVLIERRNGVDLEGTPRER